MQTFPICLKPPLITDPHVAYFKKKCFYLFWCARHLGLFCIPASLYTTLSPSPQKLQVAWVTKLWDCMDCCQSESRSRSLLSRQATGHSTVYWITSAINDKHTGNTTECLLATAFERLIKHLRLHNCYSTGAIWLGGELPFLDVVASTQQVNVTVREQWSRHSI